LPFEKNTKVDMPKVSIIIPLYNQSTYIGESIQSALDQTFRDFEVIVVDDGSTDGSSEVIKGFGDHIRCIRQENKGLAGARNTGILAARGEFIALLDADDEWLPTYLERMVALANQEPEASSYYCQAQAIDVDGNELPQIFGGPALHPEKLYHALLRANFIIPSTILMCRSVVVEAGLFDQGLRSCEDWDLWLRLLPTHKIVGIDDVLVRYRIHGSSLSTNPAGMQKAIRAVVEKHFGMGDEKPEEWTFEKRRAFGGMYRYYAISSIQRKGDWEAGALYLGKALIADPSLSEDLNTFYEFILGAQPAGYRGSSQYIDVKQNKSRLISAFGNVLKLSQFQSLQKQKRRLLSNIYYATGLVLYNSGQRRLSRSYFLHAVQLHPRLLSDPLLITDVLKSFLSRKTLNGLKKYKEMRVPEAKTFPKGQSNK
jgi:glycosyltransferase involved in cell wall biosynthesis